MLSHELFISSPWCTCADASDYVRSLLCATLLVGSVVVQCKSLTSFITQASKPSLDLFPRKCTYAKVIGLRNMVLWNIGFIANRYRIPPTKLACVRYCGRAAVSEVTVPTCMGREIKSILCTGYWMLTQCLWKWHEQKRRFHFLFYRFFWRLLLVLKWTT